MCHVLDVWWKDKTFPRFPDLPMEIAYMIWELSIPARYINPRPQGSIAFPGPPAAAYVCSGSRRTALRLGGPYRMDYNNRKDISVWFTPTKDVILHEHLSTSPRKVLCPLSAWSEVQKVVLRLNNMSSTFEWKYIDDIITLPKLKEVFVMPTGIRDKRRLVDPRNWPPDIKSEIFEEDTYRLVSLDDSTKVDELFRLLRTDERSIYASNRLREAERLSSEHLQDLKQLSFRDAVTIKFEVQWLRRKSVPFGRLNNGTVRKTPEVHQALKSMPAIRIVSGWFDFSCEIPPRDHLRRRNRAARQPRYIYNRKRHIRAWRAPEEEHGGG